MNVEQILEVAEKKAGERFCDDKTRAMLILIMETLQRRGYNAAVDDWTKGKRLERKELGFLRELELMNTHTVKRTNREVLEDFKKDYENSPNFNSKFYELFEIKCKKCGSTDIEAFGEYDDSGVYYAGETGANLFVIKCHSCGSAKTFGGYGDGFIYDLLEINAKEVSPSK